MIELNQRKQTGKVTAEMVAAAYYAIEEGLGTVEAFKVVEAEWRATL